MGKEDPDALCPARTSHRHLADRLGLRKLDRFGDVEIDAAFKVTELITLMKFSPQGDLVYVIQLEDVTSSASDVFVLNETGVWRRRAGSTITGAIPPPASRALTRGASAPLR